MFEDDDKRRLREMGEVYAATSWVHSRLAEDADAWPGDVAAEVYESAQTIDRRYADSIPRLAGDAESVAHRAWMRIKSILVDASTSAKGGES